MISDKLTATSGRTYVLEDEGTHFEVHLVEDGHPVGAVIVDVEPMGVDAALKTALLLAAVFQKANGAEPQAAYP